MHFCIYAKARCFERGTNESPNEKDFRKKCLERFLHFCRRRQNWQVFARPARAANHSNLSASADTSRRQSCTHNPMRGSVACCPSLLRSCCSTTQRVYLSR